jgi:hypothetical protein
MGLSASGRFLMKNIQAGLVELNDPDLRKSSLDHAAAACAAAEARAR